MALTDALGQALAGLTVTQAGVAVAARNIANAGQPGYTREVYQSTSLANGSAVPGIATRQLDAAVQRQLRTENAGGAYADTMSTYLDRVDSLFGQPGGASSLDTLFNNMTQAVQALAASPSDATAQSGVLQAGQALASSLNDLSNNVQSLRQDAEGAIGTDVSAVNEALDRLQQFNTEIVQANGKPQDPQLLDERDQAIDDLSKLIDIRVIPQNDGSVTVFTQSGALLFDRQASHLEFDQRANVDANALYDPDPTKRGVGTITLVSPNGGRIDLLRDRGIRSGELGALVDLRDRALVDTQNQLDTLADGLAKSLAGRDVAGTPAGGPSPAPAGYDLDVSGLSQGDVVHLTYTQGGVTRNVSIVRVDDPTMLPLPDSATNDPNDTVIGVDFSGLQSGSAAAAAAAIQNALQTRFGSAVTVAASGTVLQVRDGGAAGTSIDALSATETNTGLDGSATDPSLAFFSDAGSSLPYTGNFEGQSQKVGFAARIAVNPALLADPSRLVLSSATTLAGDATRPNAILSRLTKTTGAYQLGSGTQAFTGTLGSLTQAIVAGQASRATAAKQVSDGQKIVVQSLQSRFDQTSGVNMDQELSDLVTLQNAYAANARVLSTVQQMIQDLLNAV